MVHRSSFPHQIKTVSGLPPMNQFLTGHGASEKWNSITPQAAKVNCLQIWPSERKARHPWCDSSLGCSQHLTRNHIFVECIKQHFFGFPIAIIQYSQYLPTWCN